jgi:hypothetical protein
MLLLIGPAVAVIGIVAVVFVMRHKSVEKRSMYSSRRSQIEHKVRAARQRTLAPTKRGEKAEAFEEASSAAPTLTYEPSAYAGPPVAPPPKQTHQQPAQSAWDLGPVTTPAPAPPPFTPPAPAPPPFTPPAPAIEPPPYEPAAAQPEWTPTPPAPVEPEPPPPPAERAATSAGGGASWSIVGESKATAESEPVRKKKGSKDAGQTGAWELASGEALGDDADEGPRKPSAALAIAQYAVLVVGLVMVLVGVVVMVANSHGS